VQGKVLTPVQQDIWRGVVQQVGDLGLQLQLATPKLCILCCKSCNQDVEKYYFFAKDPTDSGKWHRFDALGNNWGPIGDTLAAQFNGVSGMAEVLAVHRLLVESLFTLKLCGGGGWDEISLPEDSDEIEALMLGGLDVKKPSVVDWIDEVQTAVC